jgi:hypothetical protein
MATLNKSRSTTRIARVKSEATVNLAGGTAYKLNATKRLIERTVGAFWQEDLFYAKGSKISADIVKDISEVARIDPKFPLQLAAWARNDLYLRTTPQVILVEAANIEACKPFVREYTPKIVKRADELSEVIAYQLSAHGKPIPNSLKKGLADAFATFNEYQLNKYDSSKNAVSLSDVLHLIYRRDGYPVSKAMWNYLVNGEVDAEALPQTAALKAMLKSKEFDDEAKALIAKSGATWETVTSHFGSTKEVWESVIPNMGYMALLRNLRNFEQKEVDLKPVLKRISDPEQVKRSKQLPFRFYSAYKNVSKADIKTAISRAFEASASNVTFEGRTGVIVDLSGSMNGSRVSNHSDITYKDIAAVMGALAIKKADQGVVVGFADHAQTINLNIDDTMMTNLQKIARTNLGGATYADKGFKELAKHGEFDRIILISDMQCYKVQSNYWGGWSSGVYDEWKSYHAKYPKTILYSLDVAAYGTAQVPTFENNVVIINGWSDKALDFINLSEKRDVMESEIKKW